MATKTSILIFYLTIAKTQKYFKWTTIGTLVVVNVAGLALTLMNIFQCRPLTVIFVDPKPSYAQCVDIMTLFISSAPVNIITDLLILLLPMPVLKSIRLPRKQKLILYITFGFGVFVTAIDVVRIYALQQGIDTRVGHFQAGNNTSGSSRNRDETDFSWYAALSFMWSAVEVNLGIMIACVPGIKPLVARFMPAIVRDSGTPSPEKHGAIATLNILDMAIAQRIPSTPVLRADGERPETSGQDDDAMGMMDFLTTPDMSGIAQTLQRTPTAMTNTTIGRPVFYDFVNMNNQKSITSMTSRESIRPIIEVTTLFFLWGFAYGLLNTLNARFQVVAAISGAQTIAVHSVYFAGYLIGPLTFGRLILKHWGFKACYMVGLMIYGTGTLIFWPAAVLTSFAAFLVSNFIVGLGLSTLEIAANPFIALCGPPKYAEIRLNLSQGFQAIGTVLSPLLASKVLFTNVRDEPSLIDVQWTYLALCLFTFSLAYVYFCIKIPEVIDDGLEDFAEQTFTGPLAALRNSNSIWITLGFSTFALFCYVGAQESIATGLASYLHSVNLEANPTNVEAIGHTLFAASRFLAAFAGFLIKPRHLLFFFFVGATVFSALSMSSSGNTAIAMTLCIYFFEGPLFSLLYTMALRGLGRHTKDASAILTAAISGGAVFPPIMHAVAVGVGSYPYSFCVVVATLAFGTVCPIYFCISPTGRQQADPIQQSVDAARRNTLVSSRASLSHVARALSRLTSKRKKIDNVTEEKSASIIETQCSSSRSISSRTRGLPVDKDIAAV